MDNNDGTHSIIFFLIKKSAKSVKQHNENNARLTKLISVEKQNEQNALNSQITMDHKQKGTSSSLNEYMNAQNQRLANSHSNRFIPPSSDQYDMNRPQQVRL